MTTFPAQLGPYTIDREIGRGGMGVVYLGHDTKLDRAVAIKALPEHLAGDAERLARFQREAKLLAQLSHPNIAGVYGLEDAGGAHYLVMEYVEGETLADRLREGPLPVDEALALGAQIAAGIEDAHEAGVIHRDLKPANIMVTPEGRAKVLDFGLAKETERSSSSLDLTASPTASVVPPATEAGRVMGTAGYLSPEQARGKRLDKRTDIWAFACILYESLTGQTLFGGETASDSIAAILEREPDFARLPARTPRRVRELLARCLEKDPHKRLRDVGDARLELENAINQREWTTGSFQAVQGARSRGPWRGALLTALGVLIGAAMVWGVSSTMLTPARTATGNALRFDMPIIVNGEAIAIDGVAIAPDGSALVVSPVGDGPLVMRELDSFEARVLQGTEHGTRPMFSPDGAWIAFYQRGRLYRIAREGGLAFPILEDREFTNESAWIDEQTIVVTPADDKVLMRVNVADRTKSVLCTIPDGSPFLGFDGICAIPGQNYVLVSVYTGNSIDAYSVLKLSLDDGSLVEVLPNATYPMLTSSGVMVFLRDSTLYSVPFDFDRGVVRGPERRVLEGLLTTQWGSDSVAALSWSGTLVYMPGQRISNGRRLVRVSDTGEIEPVSEPDALGEALAISPDGTKAAVNTLRRALESWVYDIDRGSMRRIVNEGEAYNFTWDSTGARVAFDQLLPERGYKNNDVVVRDVVASGRAEVIATLPRVTVEDWLPDDSGLLISRLPQSAPGSQPHADLAVLRFDQPETIEPLFDQRGHSAFDARFSPDGKWLAYGSDESKEMEVFVRRYPALDRAWQVSFGPSREPRWSPDSSAIYFWQDDRIMMVTIAEDESGRVTIGRPMMHLESPWPRAASRWSAWEMGPDGRFIAIEPAKWEQEPAAPRVIVNWASELALGQD